MRKKVETPPETLCRHLPCEFATYLNYCRSLRFEDRPDYSYVRRLLRDLFLREGHHYDSVWDWTLLSASRNKSLSAAELEEREAQACREREVQACRQQEGYDRHDRPMLSLTPAKERYDRAALSPAPAREVRDVCRSPGPSYTPPPRAVGAERHHLHLSEQRRMAPERSAGRYTTSYSPNL